MEQQIFHQLSSIITFEKLLLFFKEQSYYVKEKDALTKKNDNPIYKFSDSDILKQILPKEFSEQMFQHGNLTLLAFVFALRHKITQLNILLNISSLPELDHRNSVLENMSEILKFDYKKNYFENKSLLHPLFWGQGNKLPILGFSIVGCLFSLQHISFCRAFDHYDIPTCSEKTNDYFCSNHQTEIFWKNDLNDSISTQGKMFRFYLDENNFNDYDENSLQNILNHFYEKYAHFKKQNPSTHVPLKNERINEILTFYGFISLNNLKDLGLEELRKRFLEKAKKFHPDVGGSGFFP